ncbi:MAG: aminoacyl-tRNA hydrolase [candidate division WOR-3 bacterium]|nr:aminoacyl-tRNA hydrolase [candidate division WOR-3 bacterium]
MGKRSQQPNRLKPQPLKLKSKLIVFGLGNPTRKYKDTRHNVGFMVLDRLAQRYGLHFSHYTDYHVAQTKTNQPQLILIKPMLYMNNSGIVIYEYLQKHNDNFCVVCDDLALPLGKIRIRKKGSDGGHKGLASIIYYLQTTNFPRIRVGIGKPINTTATEYVLTKFSPQEKVILNKVLEKTCDAIEMIESNGIELAMNKYNPISYDLNNLSVI